MTDNFTMENSEIQYEKFKKNAPKFFYKESFQSIQNIQNLPPKFENLKILFFFKIKFWKIFKYSKQRQKIELISENSVKFTKSKKFKWIYSKLQRNRKKGVN